MSSQVQLFIEKLRDPAFREQVSYQFSLIEPGDWNAVALWITGAGFPCSRADIIQAAAANPGFFKGAGKEPQHGWHPKTLEM